MSSSSSESDKSESANAPHYVLPVNSREKYNKAYDNFILWKHDVGRNDFGEDVFLEYFKDLAKTKQPTTLWSTYSMLKATALTKNDVNIETYKKLTVYLRQMSKGHKSKRTKVFTSKDIDTFLMEAPDRDFLCIKVALIFGVQGACRGRELLEMKVQDIEKHSEQLLLVKLIDAKSKMDRSFVVRGEYKDIVEKYLSLRPDIASDRLFIRYFNGQCFKQVIGKNKISSMPAEIAAYLKLPDPKLYTGHCFRRTGATLATRSGVNLSDLKHGEENSGVYREVYIEEPNEEEANENETNLKTHKFDDIKVEFAAVSPQPSSSEACDQTQEQIGSTTHNIGDGSVTITQTTNETKTISIPNRNIIITFKNCTNVSNININF